MNQEHILFIAGIIKEWVEWVDAGQPENTFAEPKLNPGNFEPGVGLCSNVEHHPRAYRPALDRVLRQMFRDDGLDAIYPFSNTPNFQEQTREYEMEGLFDAMHENPRRMAWARKIAAMVP